MDTKKLLKSIKLHETQISVILGIIILIIAGIFVVRYVRSFKNQNPTQIQKAASTQNKEQTHKVEKGESLWKIAEKYLGKGSDWKKIADANNISTPSEIEVGQSLIIPALALDSPQPVAVESPTPKPQITKEAASIDASIKENSYTVEKGDSLWKIAVRAYGDGYKWVEIAKANNLKNPNIIHKGNVFIIPR
jgi:nucleoid-associated protein YgaU